MKSRTIMFCESLNTVINYWFGYTDVFDEEQTTKMIDLIERSGRNVDKEIAAWSAIALEIMSSGLRGKIYSCCNNLDKDTDKPVLRRLVDMLMAHWREFNLDEQTLILEFLVEVSNGNRQRTENID